MNGMVRFAMGLAGVSDKLAADIEAEIPGAQRLIAAAQKLKPSIDKIAPHVEAITPVMMNEILPVLKAEYPDLMALLPVAQQVLELVKSKTT